jgi:hypothetical protein
LRHSLARAASLGAMVRSRLHCVAAAAAHSRRPRRSATGRCCRLGIAHRSRGANGADRPTDHRRRSFGVQRHDAILTGIRRRHGDSAPITRFVRGSVRAHSRSARRPAASRSTSSAPAASCIHWQRGTLARANREQPGPPPASAGGPSGYCWGPRSHLRRFATAHSHLRVCARECGCECAVGRVAHGVCCRCP